MVGTFSFAFAGRSQPKQMLDAPVESFPQGEAFLGEGVGC